MLYVEKKVDEHWYSGFHGDKKGIFPISYVALIEGKQKEGCGRCDVTMM